MNPLLQRALITADEPSRRIRIRKLEYDDHGMTWAFVARGTGRRGKRMIVTASAARPVRRRFAGGHRNFLARGNAVIGCR